MHDAEARERGPFQPRDHPEHPFLFAPLQVGLESHQVPELAGPVLLPELDHGVWPERATAGIEPVRVSQPHRFQGAEAHGVLAPARQLLDGKASLEEAGRVPFEGLDLGLLGRQQGVPESPVFLRVQGTVQVRGFPAIVARRAKHHIVVQALALHDGAGRIEETQVVEGR